MTIDTDESAADNTVEKISQRFLSQNKEAYEVLAK